MKTKLRKIIGVAALLLATVTVHAQTNSTSVPDLLGPLPSGANLPAFNSAGLSFTNANYKFATGSHFDASGGVLNYLQADADIYHGSFVDLGAGANGTLSATGTGLHTVAVFGELLKNFNNFQLVFKGGGGIDIDATVGYGAEVAEINYNLSPITGGWLAGNGFFTYVGGNIEGDEGNFKTGGKFQKQINIYAGISF
jgi:hypothetical protein